MIRSALRAAARSIAQRALTHFTDPPPKPAPPPPPEPEEPAYQPVETAAHVHGTEKAPAPGDLEELKAMRSKLCEQIHQMLAKFSEETPDGKGNLALQSALEVFSFMTGHFDALAAFNGAGHEFRSNVIVGWMRAGRTNALEQHRQDCSGCPQDQVVQSQIAPN